MEIVAKRLKDFPIFFLFDLLFGSLSFRSEFALKEGKTLKATSVSRRRRLQYWWCDLCLKHNQISFFVL